MIEVLSDVFEVVAPTWAGVWIHDPADVEATAAPFPYGNIGRAEEITVDATLLRMVGRPLPIAEYGVGEMATLALSVVVPADADHDAAVQWWRDRLRARRTLCYRDGRGRLAYVSVSKASIVDIQGGSRVTATATAVDFSEAI